MTEEPEGPVHYQVSVTGRQAAAFFVTLLAALGLAFFFGMKTGAAAKKAPDAVTRLAAASDLAVPTLPPEELAPPSRRVEPTAAPLADTRMGFEDAAPKEAPTRAPEPKKEARPAEVTTSRPPSPTAAPFATKAPSTTSPKPAASPAPAAREEGPVWVQVAALSAANADDLAARLRKAGFRPDVAPVPQKAGVFRVRVGPYPDRSRAEVAIRRLRKENWAKSPSIVAP